MENKEFRVDTGLFLGSSVATIPCEYEHISSYENKISEYDGNNFTYMPMPYDETYLNVEEGWTRRIKPDQYIREDTSLGETLTRLQNLPFLLVDYQLTTYLEVWQGDLLINQQFVDKYSFDHERAVTYEEALDIKASERLDELDEDADQIFMQHASGGSDPIERMNIDEIRSEGDEGLLSAINEACRNRDEENRFGIITISDLNRRPVKEMIYRGLSELEITISKHIEAEYDDCRRLFKPARADTIGRWEKDEIKGLGLHIAEYMTLIELQQSLQFSDTDLVEKCGFNSKQEVNDLSSINSLRNKVMHSNRTLIHDRRDIEDTLDKLDRIEEIVNESTPIRHWG